MREKKVSKKRKNYQKQQNVKRDGIFFFAIYRVCGGSEITCDSTDEE